MSCALPHLPSLSSNIPCPLVWIPSVSSSLITFPDLPGTFHLGCILGTLACLWVAGAAHDTAPHKEKSHMLRICAFLSLLTFHLLPLSTLLLSLAYLAL